MFAHRWEQIRAGNVLWLLDEQGWVRWGIAPDYVPAVELALVSAMLQECQSRWQAELLLREMPFSEAPTIW